MGGVINMQHINMENKNQCFNVPTKSYDHGPQHVSWCYLTKCNHNTDEPKTETETVKVDYVAQYAWFIK